MPANDLDQHKAIKSSDEMTPVNMWMWFKESNRQGWGQYYSGTRLVQNDKHEYTKNIELEYYSSTDFQVLVLVFSVLPPNFAYGEINKQSFSNLHSWPQYWEQACWNYHLGNIHCAANPKQHITQGSTPWNLDWGYH